MRHRVAAALIGLLLFVSGLALGQRTRISRLQKYSVPAQDTVLDWMLLQAEINELRDRAPFEESATAPARFSHDPTTDKLTALVLVNGAALAKEPSETVREKLTKRAQYILRDLRISIPELAESEFEVKYTNLTGVGPVDFGEYKNGKLILH